MHESTIMKVAERILSSDDWQISHEQALTLIPDSAAAALDLIGWANKIRQRFSPQPVFKCGIVNAKSGRCAENCAFCAQSAHHRSAVEIYGLRSEAQLVAEGLRLAAAGATHYGIVTSGTALSESEIDTVCRVAERLRAESGLHLCASLGMLDEGAARRLKAAGIERYHHNLETARSFFDRICTTHTYDAMIATIRAARAAGLAVCSGGIFGMGESWRQRVELAFTLRELAVDSVPINFLNPIPGTRLEGRTPMPPLEALACIALFRFIHPHRDITVCGGRESTLKDFQSWVFLAGANGLMVGNYLTTQGRSIEMDLEMIAALGLSGSF